MKYNQNNTTRKDFEKIGQMMFDQHYYSDDEVVDILNTLDQAIGLHDGMEGHKNLTSYALVVTHSNFLNMARLRGIVEC